jgi:sigma-B regulation protein RsbU (phosphoserine phosphatase)
MATVEQGFLQSQLEERKHRLQHAIEAVQGDGALTQLLQDVDAALERVSDGSFGICHECHEPIEKDRLLADPLICYCLDHLPVAQRRALEQDLELAAKLQRGLLPPQDLQWSGWELRYHYEPAQMVSGDYCDVIRPENGTGELFFVLADVSGKGVAASMLMAQLHAMFRSLVSAGLPLDQIVSLANRLFCESALTGQYATLVCGRAGAQGEIEICNAGHPPAFIVRKDRVEKIESGGVPVGMFASGRYSFQKTRLAPGDSLFLYSDGLTEARNSQQAEYGIDRASALLSKQKSDSARQLAATSLDDLRAFSGGAARTDDLTLMVLRRAG